MKSTNDQSLFAWGFKSQTYDELIELTSGIPRPNNRPFQMSEYGLFASSPDQFLGCRNVVFHFRYAVDSHMGEENGATRMDMPLISLPLDRLPKEVLDFGFGYDSGLIPCGVTEKPHYLMGILLLKWRYNSRYIRVRPDADTFTFLVHIKEAARLRNETVWVDDLLRLRRDKNPNDVMGSLRWSIIIIDMTQVAGNVDFTSAGPFSILTGTEKPTKNGHGTKSTRCSNSKALASRNLSR